jgi:hypothetical protein
MSGFCEVFGLRSRIAFLRFTSFLLLSSHLISRHSQQEQSLKRRWRTRLLALVTSSRLLHKYLGINMRGRSIGGSSVRSGSHGPPFWLLLTLVEFAQSFFDLDVSAYSYRISVSEKSMHLRAPFSAATRCFHVHRSCYLRTSIFPRKNSERVPCKCLVCIF